MTNHRVLFGWKFETAAFTKNSLTPVKGLVWVDPQYWPQVFTQGRLVVNQTIWYGGDGF